MHGRKEGAEDRPHAYLQCEGNKSSDSASAREIAMILKAFMVKRLARCGVAKVPVQRSEQYSIELRMKALRVDKSSGV